MKCAAGRPSTPATCPQMTLPRVSVPKKTVMKRVQIEELLDDKIEHDRGPVLVTVEYRIDPRNRQAFLGALEKLGYERRRDGAGAYRQRYSHGLSPREKQSAPARNFDPKRGFLL
jgi:hypothetical protein